MEEGTQAPKEEIAQSASGPQVTVSLEAQTQEPRSSLGSSTFWTGSWTNSEPSTTSEQASHFDPLDKVKIIRARELDKMEEQDDVFSGTPPKDSSHHPLCGDREDGQDKPAKTYRPVRRVSCLPPRDCHGQDRSRSAERLGLVQAVVSKAMIIGTREASCQWAKRVREIMLGAGFWEVLGIPALFYHDEWCVTLSCHGDDFIDWGESDDLDRLDALMMQSVETKVLPRIGPEEFGGQEADPTYSRQIAVELGLSHAKDAYAPCSAECGNGRRDLEQPVDPAAEAMFRKLAGTAL